MKCERCQQNEASCFYEINTNGSVHTLALCSACAKQSGVEGEVFFPAFDGGFGNLFQSLFEGPKKPASGKACPSCKTTWRELASRGRPGCPQCYLTFGEELEPTLRSMHGNTTHTGRAPAKASEKRERESRLAALRREMSEAIASENFERAATLRDEIRALEQK